MKYKLADGSAILKTVLFSHNLPAGVTPAPQNRLEVSGKQCEIEHPLHLWFFFLKFKTNSSLLKYSRNMMILHHWIHFLHIYSVHIFHFNYLKFISLGRRDFLKSLWVLQIEGCHFFLQGIFSTQGWNPGLHTADRFFTVWAIRQAPNSWQYSINLTFRSNDSCSLPYYRGLELDPKYLLGPYAFMDLSEVNSTM